MKLREQFTDLVGMAKEELERYRKYLKHLVPLYDANKRNLEQMTGEANDLARAVEHERREHQKTRMSFTRLMTALGYSPEEQWRWFADQAIESDYIPPKWHRMLTKQEQDLRDKIDWLTRLRKHGDEPAPPGVSILRRMNNGSLQVWDTRYGMLDEDWWRPLDLSYYRFDDRCQTCGRKHCPTAASLGSQESE